MKAAGVQHAQGQGVMSSGTPSLSDAHAPWTCDEELAVALELFPQSFLPP